MDTKALRQKILDLAIRGKLVPQNLEDEPASVLLERIRAEKEQMVKDGKLKAKDIKKDTVIFRGDDNLHYEKFADGTVKCIEDEIPFEVPEGWSWCRLGNITDTIQYGLNNSAEQSGTYRFLRITDIQNGKVNWDIVPFTNTNESAKYLLHINDIVFARTGATVGKSFLITELPYETVYASYLLRIRLIGEILPQYIYQFFNSQCYWKQITGKAVGVGQPNCNGTSLKELFIPFPPLSEQERILSIAEAILEYVDIISQEEVTLVNLINNTKSKILDLAIRGKLVPQDPNDEPASALLERIRAEKEELIKQGKIKRDKKASIIFRGNDNSYYLSGNKEPLEMPFEIPDSWAWSTLYEICNYGETTNINAEEIPDGAWILDLEDIEKDSGKILQKVTNKLRKSTSTKHQFRPGMVLYSKLRPYLNKVIVANESGYCTSEILPLRFVKDVQPEYAQIFLMSPYFVEYANNCSYGMKMPRLGTKDGQKAFFPVPPHKEQIKIVEFVKDATDYIDSIYNSL